MADELARLQGDLEADVDTRVHQRLSATKRVIADEYVSRLEELTEAVAATSARATNAEAMLIEILEALLPVPHRTKALGRFTQVNTFPALAALNQVLQRAGVAWTISGVHSESTYQICCGEERFAALIRRDPDSEPMETLW